MGNFRQQLIAQIIPTVVVLGVLFAAVFLLGFEIDRRVRSLNFERKTISDNLNALNSFASLESQFSRVRLSLPLLENSLPRRDELIDFRKEMERLAGENKLDFGFSFGGETPPAASEAGRISFVINGKGDEDKVLNFLRSAEDSRFLVNFLSINLSRSEAGVFAITIGGEVFFR